MSEDEAWAIMDAALESDRKAQSIDRAWARYLSHRKGYDKRGQDKR